MTLLTSIDEHGNTLLLVAAQNGLKRISKLLIRHNIGDLDRVNKQGRVSFFTANYMATKISVATWKRRGRKGDTSQYSAALVRWVFIAFTMNPTN